MEWLGGRSRRVRVIGAAHGDVLEIDVGTGRNLEHYPADGDVTGIDISDLNANGVLFAGIMYVSIVITALVLHGGFGLLGLTPESRGVVSEVARFEIDYTFWLNLVMLFLAGWLVWMHHRFLAEEEQESEPVGGLTVKRAFVYLALTLHWTAAVGSRVVVTCRGCGGSVASSVRSEREGVGARAGGCSPSVLPNLRFSHDAAEKA